MFFDICHESNQEQPPVVLPEGLIRVFSSVTSISYLVGWNRALLHFASGLHCKVFSIQRGVEQETLIMICHAWTQIHIIDKDHMIHYTQFN